jgi:hypothetical protein
MPIMVIPLRQHVKVKQSSLSQQIVGLPHKVHQKLKSGGILNLIIIIYHQLGV